ncbi:MAG: rod shape-determining protein MreC [Rhodospirillales bacterium]|nr:rod shape-determining protein MreC [Rhodospirillales bacterium]
MIAPGSPSANGRRLNERTRSEHRTVGAVRTVVQRFAYFALVLVAIGLMMLGKVDTVMMERLRLAMVDTVAPILERLSAPADAIAEGVEGIRRLVAVHQENARLRLERDRLVKWQAVALRLETENAALRRLLYFVPDPRARYVTGRVIADTGGTFAHSLLLNAGTADGVAKGNVVLTGDGLVGRVVGVAQRTSRVLLITDLNSRIPVEVSPAQTKALLAGSNTDQPLLIHVEPEASIAVGDRVSTSGDAGAFPPGLPIGLVSAVEEGVIRVKPFIRRSHVQYVRVVDYGLQGILGSSPAIRQKTSPGDDAPAVMPDAGEPAEAAAPPGMPGPQQ